MLTKPRKKNLGLGERGASAEEVGTIFGKESTSLIAALFGNNYMKVMKPLSMVINEIADEELGNLR
jgi:hypothetical protein